MAKVKNESEERMVRRGRGPSAWQLPVSIVLPAGKRGWLGENNPLHEAVVWERPMAGPQEVKNMWTWFNTVAFVPSLVALLSAALVSCCGPAVLLGLRRCRCRAGPRGLGQRSPPRRGQGAGAQPLLGWQLRSDGSCQ